jgi:hypothetical protein
MPPIPQELLIILLAHFYHRLFPAKKVAYYLMLAKAGYFSHISVKTIVDRNVMGLKFKNIKNNIKTNYDPILVNYVGVIKN